MVGHARGMRLLRRVEFETDDLRYEAELTERLVRALVERPRRQFHFSNTGAFGVGQCGLHQCARHASSTVGTVHADRVELHPSSLERVWPLRYLANDSGEIASRAAVDIRDPDLGRRFLERGAKHLCNFIGAQLPERLR